MIPQEVRSETHESVHEWTKVLEGVVGTISVLEDKSLHSVELVQVESPVVEVEGVAVFPVVPVSQPDVGQVLVVPSLPHVQSESK